MFTSIRNQPFLRADTLFVGFGLDADGCMAFVRLFAVIFQIVVGSDAIVSKLFQNCSETIPNLFRNFNARAAQSVYSVGGSSGGKI